MNQFSASSFQLRETGKWAPAGTLFVYSGDGVDIQEFEFPPENRFDRKEEADNFFANYFVKKGFFQK